MQEFKKKKFRSGTTALIITNEEMKDVMKIIKSLESSTILMEDVNQRIENETKKNKGELLKLIDKGAVKAGQ